MEIIKKKVFIINSFLKKINLCASESMYKLIIIVMLLVFFWLPYNNTNSMLYRFSIIVFYILSISGRMFLKYNLNKNERNYYEIVIIYYFLFLSTLISVITTLIEIINRIVVKSDESISSFNYFIILKYINDIPLLIIVCSVITIFLLQIEMWKDGLIIKKIVFINKQFLLVITVLAIFSIRLDHESISNQLSMGLLFSIYPLSFMYNIFEVISERKNIKKTEDD